MSQKSKVGPKPKHDYTDQMFLLQIEGWARDGYDDKQIAEMLSLDPATFSRKKSEIDQICQALSRGRRPLEVLVENSLFKRATGMKITRKTVTRKLEFNHDTGESDYVTYESEEVSELPPDVKAQELWLRNRKPKQWNSQIDKVELSGAVATVIKVGYGGKEGTED